MSSLEKTLRSGLLGLVLGLGLLAAAPRVFSDDLVENLPNRIDTASDNAPKMAIKALAAYFVPRQDASERLKEIGFDFNEVGIEPERWKRLSMVDQVSLAYSCARDRNGTVAHETFLALLAKSLAQSYPGIEREPSLTPYLRLVKDDVFELNEPLAFAKVPTLDEPLRSVLRSHFTSKVCDAIDVLAMYAEGRALGRLPDFLSRHTRLPRRQLVTLADMLSTSPEDTIRLVLASLPPGKREAVLEAMIKDAAERYPAARAEPAFKSWLPAESWRGPAKAPERAPITTPLNPLLEPTKHSAPTEQTTPHAPTERSSALHREVDELLTLMRDDAKHPFRESNVVESVLRLREAAQLRGESPVQIEKEWSLYECVQSVNELSRDIHFRR